ncbi:MAG TPA: ImcF-related family protein [Polyangiaceae bacterium]|jgi:serine/threonine protein kinase
MSALQQLTPGDVFAADFRILRPLSEGGMGAVYVVEQVSTGKQRALKLMHPQLVSDPKLLQRFEQEARVGARIESDHVVEVVAAGVDAATGTPWLAMELLGGTDLAKRVRERGSMPSSEVLEIFSQLCHALGAAHAAGVVHRDLKPENIFLAVPRRPGVPFTVKILDFGIAKVVAEAQTKETAAVGSPIWMSPEQTSHEEGVSTATDVWALGLIAFHLLTGGHFWRAVYSQNITPTMLLREIVINPIPLPSVRAQELKRGPLPPGFDAWFARCVDRSQKARFQDAREMFAAFEVMMREDWAIASTAPAPSMAVSLLAATSIPPIEPQSPPASALPPTAYQAPAPWSTSAAVGIPPAPAPTVARRSSAARWIALAVAVFVVVGGGGVSALVVYLNPEPLSAGMPPPSVSTADTAPSLELTFVQATKTQLEHELTPVAEAAGQTRLTAAEYGLYFARLKTYLSMADPQRIQGDDGEREITALTDTLARSLGVSAAPEKTVLGPKVEAYVHMVAQGRVPPWTAELPLVTPVRAVLAQTSPLDRDYDALVREANEKVAAITRQGVFRGAPFDEYMTSRSKPQAIVPGAFTRSGWESYVRDALDDRSLKKLAHDRWVLGEAEEMRTQQNTLELGQLESRYFNEYRDAWAAFVKDFQVRRPDSDASALQELSMASEPPWPMLMLLQTMAANTRLPGSVSTSKTPRRWVSPVEEAFAPMVTFGVPLDDPAAGGTTGLSHYIEKIVSALVSILTDLKESPVKPGAQRVAQAYDTAQRATSLLLASTQTAFTRPLLAPLLLGPLGK